MYIFCTPRRRERIILEALLRKYHTKSGYIHILHSQEKRKDFSKALL